MVAQCLPFLGKGVSLSLVICKDNIVKDRSSLDLPQVKTEEAEVGILVNGIIILILWIGNLLRFPEALVCWIRDPLHIPVALVLWIVLHGRLPFTILLIIPVIGLLGLSIHDSLLGHPVIRLLIIGIGNLLGLQDLPVFFD